MRVIWLGLAACAGCGSPPPPSPPAVSSAAPADPAPAAPPTQTSARVSAEHGAWTDIIIEGTSSLEQLFCKRLVESEVHDGLSVKHRVIRECAAEPLPPPPPASVLLVTRDELSQLDLMFAGAAVSETDEPTAGVIVRSVPLPDRRACEMLIVRLEAEDEQSWIATQAATAEFLDRQLKEAIERQTQACAPSATTQQFEVERRRRECDRVTREREILDAKRAKPEPRPVKQRACRVR